MGIDAESHTQTLGGVEGRIVGARRVKDTRRKSTESAYMKTSDF